MPPIRFGFTSCFGFLTLLLFAASVTFAESPGSWPQWRGSTQTGAATGSEFPQKWSEDDNQGIGWKTNVPGLGGSTPITFGTTAFLTSGVDGKNTLIAVNTQSGDIVWSTVIGDDMGKKHKKGGGSNPSPITDGELIYAFFRSGDLGCVDMSGKIVWQTSIKYDAEKSLWWDLGTSPILTDKAVVVAVMHTGPSYLVGYDKQTGKQIWKADRDVGAPKEAAQSYATPVNVTVKGQDAIAVMGADHLTLHSASDGKELGRLGGFNPTSHQFFRSISSPAAHENVIICPYARGATLTAVNMDQLADGAGSDAIVWFRDDVGSDVPTPSIQDGRVYIVGDGKQSRGTITCVDVNDGKTIWTLRLEKSRESYSSSPLVAGDFLYVTREDARTYVIGPLSSDKPTVIATNTLSDNEQYTVASPIPVKKGILLRSKHRLYQLVAE